jgi:hypothetical protein
LHRELFCLGLDLHVHTQYDLDIYSVEYVLLSFPFYKPML